MNYIKTFWDKNVFSVVLKYGNRGPLLIAKDILFSSIGAATIKEQSANLDLIMSRTIGLKGLCHAICHLFKNFKAKTFLTSIEL